MPGFRGNLDETGSIESDARSSVAWEHYEERESNNRYANHRETGTVRRAVRARLGCRRQWSH